MSRPVLLLSLVVVLAPDVAAQQASKVRFVHWLYGDATALVFEKAAPNAPRYAVQGLLILLPFTTLDRPVNDAVEEGHRGLFADYVRATNSIGGPEATLPVLGVFAVSLATGNERLQDAAFTSVESMLYAGALAYGVKYVVGRVRPEETGSPFKLKPFSGHTSFPSGHTTTAFAVLTPWALYYPHPVTYAAVALLGAGTAFSRVARERHWFTDVVGGATIGVVTAHYLVYRHTQKTVAEGTSWQVAPTPDGLQLSLRWTW